ncbi:metal ABC transporter permease [Dactylosporangium cerinum]
MPDCSPRSPSLPCPGAAATTRAPRPPWPSPPRSRWASRCCRRTGFTKDLTAYLTGSILTVTRQDLGVAAAVTAAVALVLAAGHKALTYTAFDHAGARAAGYRTAAIDLGVLLLISVVVATAVPAVGTILTLALVVAPAAAARLWTDRIGTMTALAVAVAVTSAVAGLLLSRAWDVAAGGAISLTAATVFAVSLLIARRRY